MESPPQGSRTQFQRQSPRTHRVSPQSSGGRRRLRAQSRGEAEPPPPPRARLGPLWRNTLRGECPGQVGRDREPRASLSGAPGHRARRGAGVAAERSAAGRRLREPRRCRLRFSQSPKIHCPRALSAPQTPLWSPCVSASPYPGLHS